MTKKQKKLRRTMKQMAVSITGAIILLVVMVISSHPQSSNAAPGDLSSAVSKYPKISGTSLQSCDLCHAASGAPNLNPYGSAYKAQGRSTAAFALIENLDSDSDGFTNLQEINALTFPGNAASHPSIPTATQVPTTVPKSTNTPVPTLPTNNPPATPTVGSTSGSVTIVLTPPSVLVDGVTTATVNLNNVSAGGYASAEFTCTYNPAYVEISAIRAGNLFGADPVVAVNGPQNGSFIFAIAGSKGNKASTGGAAFTFSVQGERVGQSVIDCKARVSTGNLSLVTIPSTPANLVIALPQAPAQGTFAGKVLAGKPVSVTLNQPDNSVAGSIIANADGSFSLSAPAGTYTAIASAPGYLKAQGAVSISGGNTTTFQPINLLAGDIDGNNFIDQFDALTIGINYNGTAPSAADLNNDGTINVLDLEILARNYRQTGPLAWQ